MTRTYLTAEQVAAKFTEAGLLRLELTMADKRGDALEAECERLTGELTRARVTIQGIEQRVRAIRAVANTVAKFSKTQHYGEAILRLCAEILERE